MDRVIERSERARMELGIRLIIILVIVLSSSAFLCTSSQPEWRHISVAQQELSKLLSEARKAMASGNKPLARQLLEQALTLDDNNVPAWLLLSIACGDMPARAAYLL